MVSKEYVGAAIGRPAVESYEFAGSIGKYATFSCRASNARPYIVYQ
jgi:hypothetical protein